MPWRAIGVNFFTEEVKLYNHLEIIKLGHPIRLTYKMNSNLKVVIKKTLY